METARRACRIGAALAVLCLLVGAAPVGVRLPASERGEDWDAALAMAGFATGGEDAPVRLEAEEAAWRLRVRDRAGARHELLVEPPRSERDREEIVWLAVSLLHPVLPLDPPETGEPAAPAAEGLREQKGPEPERPRAVAEQKGSEPERSRAVPEQKGSEPERSAAVAEQKGSEPERSAAVAEQKGSEPERPAAVAEQKGSEPERSPAAAEQKGPEPERSAAVAEQKGSEPERPPAAAEQKGPEPERLALLAVPEPAVLGAARVGVRSETHLARVRLDPDLPWITRKARFFARTGTGLDVRIGTTPAPTLRLDLGLDAFRGRWRFGLSAAAIGTEQQVRADGTLVVMSAEALAGAWLGLGARRSVWLGLLGGARSFDWRAIELEPVLEDLAIDLPLAQEHVGTGFAGVLRLEAQVHLRLAEWLALSPYAHLQVEFFDGGLQELARDGVFAPVSFGLGVSVITMRHVGRGLPSAAPRRPMKTAPSDVSTAP